jgi:hypothetical protein
LVQRVTIGGPRTQGIADAFSVNAAAPLHEAANAGEAAIRDPIVELKNRKEERFQILAPDGRRLPESGPPLLGIEQTSPLHSLRSAQGMITDRHPFTAFLAPNPDKTYW